MSHKSKLSQSSPYSAPATPPSLLAESSSASSLREKARQLQEKRALKKREDGRLKEKLDEYKTKLAIKTREAKLEADKRATAEGEIARMRLSVDALKTELRTVNVNTREKERLFVSEKEKFQAEREKLKDKSEKYEQLKCVQKDLKSKMAKADSKATLLSMAVEKEVNEAKTVENAIRAELQKKETKLVDSMTECDSLRSRLGEYERRLAEADRLDDEKKLLSKVIDLLNQLQTLNERTDIDDHPEDLDTVLGAVENEIAQLTVKFMEVESSTTMLEKENKTIAAKVTEAAEQNDKLKGSLEKVQEQLEAEYVNREKLIAGQNIADDEIEEKNAQLEKAYGHLAYLEETESKLAKSEASHEATQRALERRNEEVSALEAKLKEYEAKTKELEKGHQASLQELERLNGEVSELHETVADTKVQGTTKIQERDAQLDAARGQLALMKEVESQLAVTLETREAAQREVEAKEREVSSLQSNVAKREAEIDVLKANIKDVASDSEKVQEKCDAMKVELTKERKENEEVLALLDEARAELDIKNEQLEEFRKEHAVQKAALAELDEKQSAATAAEASLHGVVAQLQATQMSRESEIRGLHGFVEELQESLDVASSELGDTQAALKKMAEQVTQARCSNAEDIIAAREALDKEKAKAEDLQDRANRLENQLDTLREQYVSQVKVINGAFEGCRFLGVAQDALGSDLETLGEHVSKRVGEIKATAVRDRETHKKDQDHLRIKMAAELKKLLEEQTSKYKKMKEAEEEKHLAEISQLQTRGSEDFARVQRELEDMTAKFQRSKDELVAYKSESEVELADTKLRMEKHEDAAVSRVEEEKAKDKEAAEQDKLLALQDQKEMYIRERKAMEDKFSATLEEQKEKAKESEAHQNEVTTRRLAEQRSAHNRERNHAEARERLLEEKFNELQKDSTSQAHKSNKERALIVAERELVKKMGDMEITDSSIPTAGLFTYLEELRMRLKFFALALRDSTGESMALNYEELRELWLLEHENYLSEKEREFFLNWLKNLRSDEQTILTAASRSLFKKEFSELDFESLDQYLYDLIRYWFEYVNWKEGLYLRSTAASASDRTFVLKSFDCEGMNYFWRAALEASCDEIGQNAVKDIVSFNSALAPELFSLREKQFAGYFERAMKRLGELSVDVRGNGSRSETSKHRMLRCFKLVRAFLRELVPVAASHGSKPDSFKVNVKSVTSKLSYQVEVSPLDTIAELREMIAKLMDVPGYRLRLIAHGQELKEEQSLIRSTPLKAQDIVYTTTRPADYQQPSSSEGRPLVSSPVSQPEHEVTVLHPIVSSEEYRDQLLNLLGYDHDIASEAYEVLVALPSDLRQIEALSSIDDGFDWFSFIDASCPFRLLYSLQTLELLESGKVGTKEEAADWRERFSTSGGIACLLDTLLKVEPDMEDGSGNCSSLPSVYMRVLERIASILNSFLYSEDCISSLTFSAIEERLTAAGLEKADNGGSVGSALPSAFTLHPSVSEHLLARSGIIFNKVMDIFTTLAHIEPKPGATLAGTFFQRVSSLADRLFRLLLAVFLSCPDAQILSLQHMRESHLLRKVTEWLVNILCVSQLEAFRREAVYFVCRLSALTILSEGASTPLVTLVTLVYSILECAVAHSLKQPLKLPESLESVFDNSVHMRDILALLPNPEKVASLKQLFGCFDQLIHISITATYFDLISSRWPSEISPPFDIVFALLTRYITSCPVKETLGGLDEDLTLSGFLAVGRTLLAEMNDVKASGRLSRKCREAGLLEHVLETCLFATATVDNHGPSAPPKCKSGGSRQKAFSFVLAAASRDPDNQLLAVKYLLPLHIPSHVVPSWCHSPEGAGRGLTGYVGLRNLGATCYMNSLLQQLFMTPEFAQQFIGLSGALEGTVFRQLQVLFGHMLHSQRRDYDPRPLSSLLKDSQGRVLNTAVQMDAEEFFSLLFDRLENDMKVCESDPEVLSRVYGGKYCNEIISEECEHTSTRMDPFYTHSVDVAGKSSLEESLKMSIQGEMLDGDNKYHCSQCDKKVCALKRTCIGEAPQTLIIHLKRFEYDYDLDKKFKINSYFEFPMSLDVERYTAEYLHRVSDSGKPADEVPTTGSNIYDLQGILVHMGIADSGHYISYIKDRYDPKQRWLHFNDSSVDYFSISEIPERCYGGQYVATSSVWPSAKGDGSRGEKNHSAYMLFYQKRGPIPDLAKGKPSAPSQIFRDVWAMNEEYLRDVKVFDQHYFAFLLDFITNIRFARLPVSSSPQGKNNDNLLMQVESSESPGLNMDSITITGENDLSSFELYSSGFELAVRFYVETLAHARDKDVGGAFLKWSNLLKDLVTRSSRFSGDLLTWFSSIPSDMGLQDLSLAQVAVDGDDIPDSDDTSDDGHPPLALVAEDAAMNIPPESPSKTGLQGGKVDDHSFKDSYPNDGSGLPLNDSLIQDMASNINVTYADDTSSESSASETYQTFDASVSRMHEDPGLQDKPITSSTARQQTWATEMLLKCPQAVVRQNISNILYAAVSMRIRVAGADVLDAAAGDFEDGDLDLDSVEPEIFPVFAFVRKLLLILPNARRHWRRYDEYFRLMGRLCALHRSIRAYMIANEAVSRLGQFIYSSSEGGMLLKYPGAPARVKALGDRAVKANTGIPFGILGALTRSCYRADSPYFFSGDDGAVEPMTLSELGNAVVRSPLFITELLTHSYAKEVSTLCAHLGFEDKANSFKIIDTAVAVVDGYQANSFPNAFAVMKILVTSNEECGEELLEYALGRVHNIFLAYVNDGQYANESVSTLDQLLALCKEIPAARHWVLEHMYDRDWIGNGLIQNAHQNVRKAAEHFLSGIILNYTAEPAEGVPRVLHAEEYIKKFIRFFVYYLPLLESEFSSPTNYGKEFKDSKPVTPPGGTVYKLVGYCRCLRMCLVSEEMLASFGPKLAHLAKLFLQTIDRNFVTDLNRGELTSLWWRIGELDESKLDLLIGGESIGRKVGTVDHLVSKYIVYHLQTPESFEYNNMYLPGFFKILASLSRRKTSFARLLSSVQIITWSFDYLVLQSGPKYVAVVGEVLDCALTVIEVLDHDSLGLQKAIVEKVRNQRILTHQVLLPIARLLRRMLAFEAIVYELATTQIIPSLVSIVCMINLEPNAVIPKYEMESFETALDFLNEMLRSVQGVVKDHASQRSQAFLRSLQVSLATITSANFEKLLETGIRSPLSPRARQTVFKALVGLEFVCGTPESRHAIYAAVMRMFSQQAQGLPELKAASEEDDVVTELASADSGLDGTQHVPIYAKIVKMGSLDKMMRTLDADVAERVAMEVMANVPASVEEYLRAKAENRPAGEGTALGPGKRSAPMDDEQPTGGAGKRSKTEPQSGDESDAGDSPARAFSDTRSPSLLAGVSEDERKCNEYRLEALRQILFKYLRDRSDWEPQTVDLLIHLMLESVVYSSPGYSAKWIDGAAGTIGTIGYMNRGRLAGSVLIRHAIMYISHLSPSNFVSSAARNLVTMIGKNVSDLSIDEDSRFVLGRVLLSAMEITMVAYEAAQPQPDSADASTAREMSNPCRHALEAFVAVCVDQNGVITESTPEAGPERILTTAKRFYGILAPMKVRASENKSRAQRSLYVKIEALAKRLKQLLDPDK